MQETERRLQKMATRDATPEEENSDVASRMFVPKLDEFGVRTPFHLTSISMFIHTFSHREDRSRFATCRATKPLVRVLSRRSRLLFEDEGCVRVVCRALGLRPGK